MFFHFILSQLFNRSKQTIKIQIKMKQNFKLFAAFADGAWEETVTCENGNRPQDWTFVSSGYTITYDEATAE